MSRFWTRRKVFWLIVAAGMLVAWAVAMVILMVPPDKPPFLEVHADADGNINGLTLREDHLPPEVIAFLATPKVPSELDQNQIRQLAIQHNLFAAHAANPQLRFVEGDVTFWKQQKRSAWELELEFLARRLLLEAADKAQVKIAIQGKLSYYSKRIYTALAARRE